MIKKAKIEITRISQWANKVRGISIIVNGEKIGKIADGETKTFEVDAGEMQLLAKIDWCKTKPLIFMAEAGEMYRFKLGSNLQGAKVFYMAAYYVMFKPSEFLYLKDLELVQQVNV
jgi:hypothetical protein